MTGSPQQQDGEAAEWHARLHARSVSNDDLARFYEWRGRPGNAAAFDAVERLWNRMEGAGGDPRISALLQDAGRDTVGDRRFRLRATCWGVGVLAALAAALAIYLVFGQPENFETGVGETLTARLDDGSRVTLDTATKLEVHYTRGRRVVELVRGQALFDVAHDPQRPFEVNADGAVVVALGTRFEVSRIGATFEVLLVDGRIAVTPRRGDAPKRLVQRGQVIVADGRRVMPGRRDPAVALSWVDGKIDFRNEPLSKAIAEVNRYARRPIVLDAPANGATEVSGVFVTGDSEAFAAAVTALLDLEQSRDADGIIHLRKGAN